VAKGIQGGAIILAFADHEYLREGIHALLGADGYLIYPAGKEEEAIDVARRNPPDLILVSLDQPGDKVAASARRVRVRAGLGENVPIVMFSIMTIAEGAEVPVGENTYATRPINFNQLRKLLGRLLRRRVDVVR
jgi:DNA-binding response OmpR family regulator